MTKSEALEIIKLLSALESWSFAESHRLPAYLQEKLSDAIDTLTSQVLKDAP